MKDYDLIVITTGMHIHPALSEVVNDAFLNLMTVDDYHQLLRKEGLSADSE